MSLEEPVPSMKWNIEPERFSTALKLASDSDSRHERYSGLSGVSEANPASLFPGRAAAWKRYGEEHAHVAAKSADVAHRL